MDKINLTAFGPLPMQQYTDITIGDATVSVAKTLPYEDILSMVQWAVNQIMDDRPFVSAPIRKIITDVALIKNYTNIDLSRIDLVEFSAAELYEWYDILIAHDVIAQVRAAIDPIQVEFYEKMLHETLDSLVAYRNSTAGILDRIQTMQQNSSEEATNILSMLDNPEELDKVKRMMELMDLHIPGENDRMPSYTPVTMTE